MMIIIIIINAAYPTAGLVDKGRHTHSKQTTRMTINHTRGSSNVSNPAAFLINALGSKQDLVLISESVITFYY